MKKAGTIQTAHLFPILHDKLMELLKSLSPKDWYKETACSGWNVKDLTAHLLDTALRRVALHRDGYLHHEGPDINTYQDLVHLVNRLNRDWIISSKRLSPQILIDMIEMVGEEQNQVLAALPPKEKAIFSVAWAGEEESKNWMDVAREYTERWHHQEQIREAVGTASIITDGLFPPLIDTFMRGLPHTFQNVEAEIGTSLKVIIPDMTDCVWFLVKQEKKWVLFEQHSTIPISEVYIPAHISWKLFTKGISQDMALKEIDIKGERSLGKKIMGMVSVIA